MGGSTPERRGFAGFVMRVLGRVSPEHAVAAERESSEWFLICPGCGHARTYAEIGGVRYGASSRGKRVRLRCPVCGRGRWHRVERRRTG